MVGDSYIPTPSFEIKEDFPTPGAPITSISSHSVPFNIEFI